MKNPALDNLAGWMLVSLKKQAAASSSLDDAHRPENAFDENIRTSWAAKTGEPGEWLQVDFGKSCRIDAVQFNFADVRSTAYGRSSTTPIATCWRFRTTERNGKP